MLTTTAAVPTVRPAHPSDLPAIMGIQARCYTAIVPESPGSMGAKLHASPGTCFVVEEAGTLLAYLLALPWRFDDPPALDAPDCRLPTSPDTLYLHDLAVSPDARGNGAADALVRAGLEAATALGLPRASLIAIQDSAPWWARYGFIRVQPAPDLAGRLAGYGEDACYMVRSAAPLA